MKRFVVISIFFVTLSFLSVLNIQAATQLRPALIQVEITSLEQFQSLLALGLDIIRVQPGEYAEILVSDADMQTLSQAGYQYKIIQPDMVAHSQAGLSGQLDMGGYHTMAELYEVMDFIHNAHPSITTARESIGYSIEGRAIYAMKISDNPGVNEDEPELFFNSLTHAREPMGMEVLLYFMNYLTNNYGSNARVDSIVNNRELWFVPLINPDGYEYNRLTNPFGGGFWRKNRRNNGDGSFGVDLNRNYGYLWGYNNIGSSPTPSSQVYRGTGPFSEPETEALRDFVLSHDFVLTVNYHTFSDLLLYPWGYTPFHPPDRLVYEMISANATAVNNYVWGPGYSTIYPTNGDADDWMYGERASKKKSISFTPEVGFSFWPPEIFIIPLAEENLEANLYFAEIAGYLYDRSFRFIRTEPDFIDTSFVYGDSFQISLKLVNQDPASPLTFIALDHDSSHYPPPLLAWGTASSEEISFVPSNLNSKWATNVAPFKFNSIPDWLKVMPESTIVVASNDSFALTITLNSSVLGAVDTVNGEVIIVSYNNRMSSLRDTTIIPIRFKDKNRRPILSDISPKTIQETSTLTFRVSAVDPEGGILSLSATNVPTNSAFMDSGNGAGSFSFNPDTTQAGVYNVDFIASDGSKADTETVEITVTPCSAKPGDVDGNNSWSLTDIVGLVNIVFKGATKPTPLCRTDCNASGGNPNLTDIVCLVNKVFKGGTNPVKIGVCCL